MKVQLSLAASQRGELYHYTGIDKALKILRSGNLELASSKGVMVEGTVSGSKSYFASLTRSRFGGFHYREGGPSVYGWASVLFTFNGNSLSENNKILPVDYWGKRGSLDPLTNKGKEVEERLVSDKHFVPIIKHIKRVDIIAAGAYTVVREGPFGSKEVRTDTTNADRQSKYVGSLVLQLKKHHIPYGFWPSTEDWAKRRGEYSYFGNKGVYIPGKSVSNTYSKTYADLKSLLYALTDIPYEKLDPQGRSVCEHMYSWPQDIHAVLNDYEAERRPTTLRPESHDIAVKIARTLARQKLLTPQDIQRFLAAKYKDYLVRREAGSVK